MKRDLKEKDLQERKDQKRIKVWETPETNDNLPPLAPDFVLHCVLFRGNDLFLVLDI